jgi:hypothetical protein
MGGKAATKKSAPKAAAAVKPQIIDLPYYCTCCEDANQSQMIRKKKAAGSVDDEPWMLLGNDGKWRPIRTCPWCRVNLA